MIDRLVRWWICRVYRAHSIPEHYYQPGGQARCEYCRQVVKITHEYTLEEVS